MADRARLYAQLAFVAVKDAEAIEDEYAWPPRPPLSDAELATVAHLRAVGNEAFERAEALGFEGGTDAAFERVAPTGARAHEEFEREVCR